jgi:hypothetical protein
MILGEEKARDPLTTSLFLSAKEFLVKPLSAVIVGLNRIQYSGLLVQCMGIW